MAHKKNQPFHLVDHSPWPFVGSIGGLVTAIGFILLMHHLGPYVLLMGLMIVLFTMGGWWYDIIKESKIKEDYTPPVQMGLRMEMALFIISEVMFFMAFFWAFFNASLFPSTGVWPPKGIHPLNPFDYPYFNTLILLLSGTTITWAHHALFLGHKKDVLKGIGFTVLLGLTFTSIQAYEYVHATFGFKEGIYPSTFYMATGFHGAHVIIGTLFLMVCWFRARLGQFRPTRHVGFEAAPGIGILLTWSGSSFLSVFTSGDRCFKKRVTPNPLIKSEGKLISGSRFNKILKQVQDDNKDNQRN